MAGEDFKNINNPDSNVKDENLKDPESYKDNVRSFKCGNCGNIMEFDPDSKKLKCTHCQSTVDIEEDLSPIHEYDFDEALTKFPKADLFNKAVSKCKSCGAEVIFDEKSISTACAFCGSPQVIKINDFSKDMILPESLIPFAVSEPKVKEIYTNWIGKSFMSPNALKKQNQLMKLKNVYIPSWTYDSMTHTYYTGEAGYYYYVQVPRTVVRDGKQYTEMVTERRVRWEYRQGYMDLFMDDILVNASKNVDSNMFKGLMPFNLKKLIPYKEDYLSNIGAEVYSVDIKQGFERAKETMSNILYSEAVRRVCADTYRFVQINPQFFDVKYKHFLLPLWICNYKFKGKDYFFMVNGDNGKIHGKKPLSAVKVTFLVILIIIILLILFYVFYTYNQGSGEYYY